MMAAAKKLYHCQLVKVANRRNRPSGDGQRRGKQTFDVAGISLIFSTRTLGLGPGSAIGGQASGWLYCAARASGEGRMDNETGGTAERVINAAESEFAVRANYWAALNPLIAPIRPNPAPANDRLQQHGLG